MATETLHDGVPHAAAAPADAPAVPSLAFFDADSARKWSKGIPHLPVAQAFEAVNGQLQGLSAAEMTPRERATLAEVMRDLVAYQHTELARRFAGKPQPAGQREREAFEQALALWHGLWNQYSACLKPLLEGDAELMGVKAKVLQRGLYVGKALVLVHGLARREPPAALWQELHAYYRLAEMLECAVQAVSDELMPQAVGVSCYSTYCHALLLALADPCGMTVRQVEIADRWLEQWSRKIFPYAAQRDTEGPVVVIDLDAGKAASLHPAAPRETMPAWRFGYPAKLATSVRGRLKRLAAGATPAELQLGDDVTSEQAVALLGYLDARWFQPPRRASDRPAVPVELCAGGVPAAYFRVGGRTFDRQDPLGRLTYQGSQHLATLGALTDYDRYREEAERNFRWEHWAGDCDLRHASLTRRESGSHRWFLEQLVTLREGGDVRLGYVTRVALSAGGELGVSVRLWLGAARAFAARPLSTAFSEDPPLPVVELGEPFEDKGQLLAPPRTFAPGRLLRTLDANPERRWTLTRLLQRGADFERIAFEPQS